MKCPVCDNVNTSMLCPKCGFDSSRDYEKYPTFGSVGQVSAVSALREQRQDQPNPVVPVPPKPEPLVIPTPPKPEPPVIPDPPKKKNKLLPLLIAAVFALTLGLGVWIGTGMGGGKPEPGEQGLTLSVLYEVLEHPDENYAIRAKFDGEFVSSSEVKWTTSDPAVVTVEDGMVTAVGEGSAIITAEYAGEKATCGFGCMFFLHDSIEDQDEQEPQNTEATAGEPDRVVSVIGPWTTNVLRSDAGIYVWGSEYRRDQISSVTFLDKLTGMPSDAWDVSEEENRKVMAWVKPNGEMYDLYIGAEGGVWGGASCAYMFNLYSNATSIIFGDAFHTDKVEDMQYMFSRCNSLISLNVSNFDTANVKEMSYMFDDCSSLRELNLSSFDTTGVYSMNYMFNGCSSLTELHLSSRFETTIASNTWGMFYNCPAGADWQHLVH